MMQQINVLNKGFVRLDAAHADDLSVVNAARVSFNKRHEQMEEGDDKLIAYLMNHRHGTPFEHNFFRFHVKAPIFVLREWHRHRIGWSYNEWSARYSELEREFYIPDVDDVVTQVGKPGAYTFERAPAVDAEAFRSALQMQSARDYEKYQHALKQGISKQQARLFLPVNIYSEMYATCNARSLMSFLSLRNTDQAQFEIRQYAIAMEASLASHMPVTYLAFTNADRPNTISRLAP
jgi:thymidylate synthase (FAD)